MRRRMDGLTVTISSHCCNRVIDKQVRGNLQYIRCLPIIDVSFRKQSNGKNTSLYSGRRMTRRDGWVGRARLDL